MSGKAACCWRATEALVERCAWTRAWRGGHPGELMHREPLGRTKFQTELQVRPDDIDMNQHVHNSRYFDYVLAARYEQMRRCYKMGMEEFAQAGLGWFIKTAHVQYHR